MTEQKVKTAVEADDYVLSQGGDNGQLGAVRNRSVSFAGGTGRPMIVEQRICHSDKIIIAINMVMWKMTVIYYRLRPNRMAKGIGNQRCVENQTMTVWQTA